jgi:hypothetical protein
MGPKRNGAAANKKRCDERNNKGKVAAATKNSSGTAAEAKPADTTHHDEAKSTVAAVAVEQPVAADALPTVANHYAGFHQSADAKQGSPKSAATDSDDEWVIVTGNEKEMASTVDCKA